jgi:hypothetical protein
MQAERQHVAWGGSAAQITAGCIGALVFSEQRNAGNCPRLLLAQRNAISRPPAAAWYCSAGQGSAKRQDLAWVSIGALKRMRQLHALLVMLLAEQRHSSSRTLNWQPAAQKQPVPKVRAACPAAREKRLSTRSSCGITTGQAAPYKRRPVSICSCFCVCFAIHRTRVCFRCIHADRAAPSSGGRSQTMLPASHVAPDFNDPFAHGALYLQDKAKPRPLQVVDTHVAPSTTLLLLVLCACRTKPGLGPSTWWTARCG